MRRRRTPLQTPRLRKTPSGRKADAVPSNPDRHQPGRRRAVLRHGSHGKRRARSTASRTAPSSPIRSGNRRASTPTWNGSKASLRFPLHVVDNGRSLREDVKALTNHSGSTRYIDIPVFLKGRNGEGDGIGRRQCTDSYKIRPIRRKVRELLGLPSGVSVELWLGISTDEAIRMKTSRDRWIENRNPLIEAGMSRRDCLAWWKERYDRPLERSACVACPFQSRQRWVETKRRWPELFAEAVEIDANMRGWLAFAKEPYLHPLRIPLAQAVMQDEAELGTDGQSDGFGNECEGHCGV